MDHRKPLPALAALSLLGILAPAHADHPTVAFGSEAAGPIGTIPTAPMPAGTWSAGLRTEIVNFDRYSDSQLAGYAAAGEEHVHSVDRLMNVSLSVAHGVTDDLTLSARLPYVDRQNIREGHIEAGEAEVHEHGDSSGVGDASVLAQYRFFDGHSIDASLIGGVKAPTGKTDVKDGGQKLDTEFQPGTGSWDWLFGASASASLNSSGVGLHGNLLYNLTTEGSQNTEMGDAFFYNVGLVYSLSHDDGHDHHGHDHSHLKWDLMLELNGEYRGKNDVDGEKDDNTGGDVIFLSPGVRLSSSDTWSLFLSVGTPVYDDYNGRQTDVDYRLVGGVGFAF
jgi:hypothetical protein